MPDRETGPDGLDELIDGMRLRMRSHTDANRLIINWLSLAVVACIVTPILVYVLPGAFGTQRVDFSLLLRWWQGTCETRCLPDPLRTWRYLVAIFCVPSLFLLVREIASRIGSRGREASEPLGRELYLGAIAAQVVLLLVFVWLFHEQSLLISPGPPPNRPHSYFPMSQLWLSGVLSLGVVALRIGVEYGRFQFALAWWEAARRLSARIAPEGGGVAAIVSAVPYVAAFGYAAVEIGKTISSVEGTIGWHIPFFMADFAAVLNGKTFFVDFTPNYQHLTPYLFAPVFRLLGHSESVFVATMGMLSLIGFCSLFVFLRMVTRSAWLALALYVPFVAISMFTYFPRGLGVQGDVVEANTFNYYSIGPLSYVGPWLLVFLCWYALRLRSSRALGSLFFAGALVAINSLSYGVPAFVGTIAAVFFTSSGERLFPTARQTLRILAPLAVGIAAAVGVFLGITWVRSGRLPDPELVATFYRFAFEGWDNAAHPIPGPHWVLSGFYLGAVLMAAAGLAAGRQTPDARRNLGMLMMLGVFGSGTLMYYIGEGYSECLVSSFSAWGLTTLLMGFAVLSTWLGRGLTSRALALRCIPVGLLLCAYFLFAIQIADTFPSSAQWHGLASWRVPAAPLEAEVTDLAGESAEPGERVAIFHTSGQRIALDLGLRDVLPFTPGQIFLVSQAKRVLDTLESGQVRKVYATGNPQNFPGEIRDGLVAANFRIVKRNGRATFYARDLPSETTRAE